MTTTRFGLALLCVSALIGCSAEDSMHSASAPPSSLTAQSSFVPLQSEGAARPDHVAHRPADVPGASAAQDNLPLWPPASSPAFTPAPAAGAVAPFPSVPAAPPLLPGSAAPDATAPAMAVPPFASPPAEANASIPSGAGPALSDPNPLRIGEPRQFVPAEPAPPASENPLRGEGEGPGDIAVLAPSPPFGSGGLLPHAPAIGTTVPQPFSPPVAVPSAAPSTNSSPLPAPQASVPLPTMPAEEPVIETEVAEIPRSRQKLPRVSSTIPPAGSVRSPRRPSVPASSVSLSNQGTGSYGASGFVAGLGATTKPAATSPPAASATPIVPPPPPTPMPAAAAPVSPPPFVLPAQPAAPGSSAPDHQPAVPPFASSMEPPAPAAAPMLELLATEPAPVESSLPESPPHFVLPEEPVASEPAEASPPPASAVVEASVATPIAPPVEVKPDEPFEIVRVFYGTDRMPILANQDSLMQRVTRFTPALILILLSLFGIGVVVTARKITWMIGTTILLIVSTLATWHGVRETIAIANLAALEEPQYSADKSYRGEIERGVCEISIPKTHKAGMLEGPSILRLEVQEDPRKHITLRKTTRLQTDAFYEQLRAQVANSPDRELLVFVHGFNVTFEDAARRTGQMAKDLKLQGAPVFFSWPADKYFLLTYGKDETNVGWATPHLKEFLLELVAQTDAKAINLVAHSMGSRALTTALREIDLQFREDARKFNQVVLAAPDIDADDFRDNIAPSIQRTAKQVTLYASSNDIALSASRFFHRNARAGDTSRGLVIVAGMHTIDVSAIDGGPWGHSYYGASDPVLNDLHLLLGSLPPERRTWLKSNEFDGQTYWAFRPLGNASAPAMLTPR